MTADKPHLFVVGKDAVPLNVFGRPATSHAATRRDPDVSPETQITVDNAMHQLRNPTGDPMLDQMVEDLWDSFNTCIPGDLVAICRVMRTKGWTHL